MDSFKDILEYMNTYSNHIDELDYGIKIMDNNSIPFLKGKSLILVL